MEKTWIKIMLSFACCMSIVGCNGGVSSTSVDENKSTLKYDTNHIEFLIVVGLVKTIGITQKIMRILWGERIS